MCRPQVSEPVTSKISELPFSGFSTDAHHLGGATCLMPAQHHLHQSLQELHESEERIAGDEAEEAAEVGHQRARGEGERFLDQVAHQVQVPDAHSFCR